MICICSAYYNGEGMYGRVFYLVPLYEIIKCTIIIIMSKLYSRYVERNSVQLFCLFSYLIERNIDDL
jgi:hypothetical protein